MMKSSLVIKGRAPELLTYALVFLFPLAGNSIRGWSSTIFVLLLLLALATRPWVGVVLHRWEKWLLIIIVLLFTIMMVSNVANGWGYRQTREFGVQVRYLAFVPIFLLLRRHGGTLRWLLRGTVMAAIMLLLQAFYEILVVGNWRVAGVYGSPGLYATQALLFASILLVAWKYRVLADWPRLVTAFAICAALAGLFVSGSRSTYITLVFMLAVAPLLIYSWKKALLLYSVSVLVIAASYLSMGVFQSRVQSGVVEFEEYMALPDPVQVPIHSSVGQRLEMWRTAWLIFKDNPIIGVGRGNFSQEAGKYVAMGVANPQSAIHPHPHNAYLEFMVSTGAVGLVLLLILLLYPYYICVSSPPGCFGVALAGKIFLLIFFVNSINEAAAFVYGNFLATFLIYFGGLFASLGRCQLTSQESRA